MGPKTLPTIWGTNMKLVTKYQICVINSCWEKCAYIQNVYKYQPSRQTGMTGPKTLPTIWHTYMKLVTKYQISALDSCREKCYEKYLGRTDRGKTVYLSPPPGSRGIKRGSYLWKPFVQMDKLQLYAPKFFFSQQLLLWTLQSIIASTDLLTSWLERIIRATKLKFHGFLCVLHSYFYHCNFPATK